MMILPTELLEKFQELIYDESSLKFSSSRLINLEVQLRKRAKIRGLDSFKDYFQLLEKDGSELEALIEGITTKETYFFRLPMQFQALSESILPSVEDELADVIRRRVAASGSVGRIPLRIWSAGCSTGEEAYSIAMTLMEGLKYPRAWDVEIIASDISREAVKSASRAYYENDIIGRMPFKYSNKYVSSRNGGGVIAEELCRLINFRVFNLRDICTNNESYFVFKQLDGNRKYIELSGYFDVIFCRNVMIYFDFEAQQQLVDGLHRCLKPGGYLFTGDAEQLHIYEHDFEAVEKSGAFFYQKRK